MTPVNWSIRRAQPGDASALASCIAAAYAQYSDRIADLPPVSEGCAEDIADNQVWVAEVGSKLVGGLVLVTRAGFIKLANVAVHPDYIGQGLGRTLIDLAESEGRKQGYREIHLNTHIAMPENIRLYRHLGWNEVGRQGNTVSLKKHL